MKDQLSTPKARRRVEWTGSRTANTWYIRLSLHVPPRTACMYCGYTIVWMYYVPRERALRMSQGVSQDVRGYYRRSQAFPGSPKDVSRRSLRNFGRERKKDLWRRKEKGRK